MISFRSDSIRPHRGAWSVTGVLTVKGHTAPVELTVTCVSAEGAGIVFRADCAVDRYAHGITMMPGVAARRLSVQIAARHQSLATPRITAARHHPERRHE